MNFKIENERMVDFTNLEIILDKQDLSDLLNQGYIFTSDFSEGRYHTARKIIIRLRYEEKPKTVSA